MRKKGIMEEIFSRAMYSDNSNRYIIYYRDFEKIRSISLPKFIKESDNFQKIPSSRITMIKKNNISLFEKKLKSSD